MKNVKDNAIDALKVAGALSVARLLENKVVGGYAAPGAQIVLGLLLANNKNFGIAGKAALAYGIANAVKRVAVKQPGGFLDEALPGNTGEGLFMLKIGSPNMEGMEGLFGLNEYPEADHAQSLLNGAATIEGALNGY